VVSADMTPPPIRSTFVLAAYVSLRTHRAPQLSTNLAGQGAGFVASMPSRLAITRLRPRALATSLRERPVLPQGVEKSIGKREA